MGYDLILKGGVVTTESGTRVADIAVCDGRIVKIGEEIPASGSRVLPVQGLRVFPGGVDVHTHLDMPFMGSSTADDFATGTAAAACGGTTTIIDFAAQERGHCLREALDAWHLKAQGRCAVDYGFHMSIVDLTEDRLREMDRLVEEGVTTFKVFMAYPGRLMLDDAAILRAMLRARDNGGMVCLHAEDGPLIDALVRKALSEGHTRPKYHALTRPISAEASAVRRAVALAEKAGACAYIVHVSSGDALDEIAAARERGLPVFGETCPQYLRLTDEEYGRSGFEGAKFVMSPPLRPKGHADRLWAGLIRGQLQAVSTDHCSFSMRGGEGKPVKEWGLRDFSRIPNGVPGIETRMPLLWDAVAKGRLSAERFVEVTAAAPARIFGLYPRKGVLAPGADADILVLDPRRKYTISAAGHHMNVDYNPYEGVTVDGSIRDVFVRGVRMVEEGRFVGSLGHGRFLERSPFDWSKEASAWKRPA